jgi:putative FmdB family regulatory protein
MPYYQYGCRDCGHAFEKKLPMSLANEMQPCPRCCSQETRKKLSTFAVAGASRDTSFAGTAPRFT